MNNNNGKQIEIDEFTNIQELVGRNFNNLSYEVRMLLHESLTPEEIRMLKTNRLTPELTDKGQAIIDQYYTEKNPTPEQLMQRKMDEWKEQQINDIGNLIFKDMQRLKQLDELAELDKPLPVGERKKVRETIQKNKDMLNQIGVDAELVIERTEFIKSPFAKQHELKTSNPTEYERIMNLEPVKNKTSEALETLAKNIGFDPDIFSSEE